jgi:hypothetical protein
MVIIVMSTGPRASGDLARRLAATLGWPCVDGTSGAGATRDAVVRAHDRRDHVVVLANHLSQRERQLVTEGVSQVRVVQTADLDSQRPTGWSDADAVLTVDVQTDPDGAIASVRDAFGV